MDCKVIIRSPVLHRELVVLKPVVGVSLPIILANVGRRSKALGVASHHILAPNARDQISFGSGSLLISRGLVSWSSIGPRLDGVAHVSIFPNLVAR